LDSYEAINTPGSPNRISYAEYPAPFLSEVALTFSFGESNEYLEIIGQPELSLSPFYLLILEGDAGENPGVVDFLHPLGTTDFRGLYHTGYLVDQLENGSQTIFIVSQPTCTIGQDLDTNDDGVLDATPWAEESDGLSLLQSEGDVGYATQTLEAMGQRISGASRFPQFEPPSGTPRWIANNGEGAGLNNTVVTLDPNTAANTPGELNRINREEYYLQVNKENSAALRASLHDLIDDHVKHGYTSDNRDVWDIMNAADEDPTDPSKIIAIYKNESYTKIPGGTGVYNREHTWPKSYGFGGDDEPCKVPYTDCHHLMASNAVYNSSRNNLFFDDCTGNCTSDPALFNAANGAGGTPEDVNLRDGDSYQVWPHRRGDIARAMFYMDVRYEGGNHGFTGCDEPDLVLTDNASLIQVTDQSPAYMGLLTTLLAWHEQDPVDDDERLRNETVYLYQGNRNPFVDHPEYIDCLYNDQCEGGIVLPSCFFARLLLWRSQGAPFCSNSDFSSVQGLVELINGTCECP
jgi:endonuclease I